MESTGAGMHRSTMPRLTPPYIVLNRQQWAALRDSTASPISEDEVRALAGVNDAVSLSEALDIFVPLARLIGLHIAAARNLNSVVEQAFTGRRIASPYIIAIAGSVAVDKSTFARLLRAVLARQRRDPRVDLVTTDGFLFSTQSLQVQDLMSRKGFPESYDLRKMLAFLEGIKAGRSSLRVPIYSHEAYDVTPGKYQIVDHPDILIFEGLNVLQTTNSGGSVASDFFDFTIYLDAQTETIEQWYVERFLKLQRTVFQQETSFFYHYKDLSQEQARDVASDIWHKINLPNLVNNIAPTRRRARVVMRKSTNHEINEIWLRQN